MSKNDELSYRRLVIWCSFFSLLFLYQIVHFRPMITIFFTLLIGLISVYNLPFSGRPILRGYGQKCPTFLTYDFGVGAQEEVNFSQLKEHL